MEDAALVLIDVQNDFCTGSLAVPDGAAIVPVINALGSRFATVIATQDWHPEKHISFASSHQGKAPFQDTVVVGRQVQRLWPDHCVQGTGGADFHPFLDLRQVGAIVRKGMNSQVDSYSGFQDNDRSTKTGLAGMLRERGVKQVVMCGLALDFCVLYTALDAAAEGFKVTVIVDACRAVNVPRGSAESALQELRKAGIELLQSDQL